MTVLPHHIDLKAVMQGSATPITFIWLLPPGHGPVDLTGYTITANLTNLTTSTTTIATGSFSVDDGTTREITWNMSSTDTGTAGPYHVVFQATGALVVYSLNAVLYIEENPAVTAIAGDTPVGVSPAEAAWVTDGYATVPDGTTLESTTGSQAKADAAEAAAIAASVPKDAAILSKVGGYELAAADNAKTIECSGTFTITCPDGLDTGFQVIIVNVGSGTITIAAATTLQGEGTQLATQYTGATVYHRGSNVWLAMGKLT